MVLSLSNIEWKGVPVIANNAADLGAILREARKAKGMSQADLAEMIGVSRQWVLHAERGAPTARLELILTALRCVDLLLDVVPDDEASPDRA